jgi:hypothetical protein
VNYLLKKKPKDKLYDKLNEYKKPQRLRNVNRTQLKYRRNAYE